jgi:hypothetical protein
MAAADKGRRAPARSWHSCVRRAEPSGDCPNDGHDDVAHQRSDDRTKCGPCDHANGDAPRMLVLHPRPIQPRAYAEAREPVIRCLAVARQVGIIWADPNHEAGQVIDNQDQAERLLRKLTEALPLSALATPALMANFHGRSFAAKITLDCKVIKVFYLGDEAGSHVRWLLKTKKKMRCSSCQSPTLHLIVGSLSRAR